MLFQVLGLGHGLDKVPTSRARSIHSFPHLSTVPGTLCVSEAITKGMGPGEGGSRPTLMKLRSDQGPRNLALSRLQPPKASGDRTASPLFLQPPCRTGFHRACIPMAMRPGSSGVWGEGPWAAPTSWPKRGSCCPLDAPVPGGGCLATRTVLSPASYS